MASRRSLKDIERLYRKGLDDGVAEVAEAFLDEATRIIEEEAVDQGTLKNSSETRKPEPLVRVVAWTANHAAFVHYGTRPHWPPLEPIKAWVRRNLARVTTTAGKNVDVIRPEGRMAERARRSPDKVIEQVARSIQAKIAKEGTAPVPWVPRALSRVKPKQASILSDAIKRRLQ